MDEANWPDHFSMDEFKALTSFKARLDYCNSNLTRIGGGSGRMVYQIDDETALKLAKNAKGVAQNKAENDEYIQRTYDHIITKVIDYHPDHLWIESRLAKKVTPNRFKQLSGGITIHEVALWMANYEADRLSLRRPFKLDPELNDAIWNNELFSDIANMGNDTGMPFGDFGVLSSYGELRGELVLVDYGLSKDAYETHYKPKPKQHYAARYENIRPVIAKMIAELTN